MVYCTVEDVRDRIMLTEEDITDVQLYKLIEAAQRRLNSEIMSYHEDEEAKYINQEKSNKIDGSNKTFYTRYHPIGDFDGDGILENTDVKVYLMNSNGERTQVTVTSVEASSGKIVLENAPEQGYKVLITYYSMPKGITPTHPYLKEACAELAAALAYTKVQPMILKHLDNLDIIKMPDTAKMHFSNYERLLHNIKSGIAIRVHDEKKHTIKAVRLDLPQRRLT